MSGLSEVELPAGMTGWLPAQRHYSENIGETNTHVLFVELTDRTEPSPDVMGPSGSCRAAGQNIPLSLAEVSGMTCSTSQCSTILPFASSRKTSMPA